MASTSSRQSASARRRLIVMIAAGVVVAVAVGVFADWALAPTSGWAAACAVYLAWVWLSIGGMDADQTKAHATAEDPTRGTSDLLTLIASVASLGALVILLLGAKSSGGPITIAAPILGLVSVALSWFLVHTLFTLRYAMLYFRDKGGIDFQQKPPPQYSDFAYVSFTLGMTYQVSDTDLQTHAIRATALRQALLSYLFGAVILAATINLIAGLAK